jgi:hypothetical protein
MPSAGGTARHFHLVRFTSALNSFGKPYATTARESGDRALTAAGRSTIDNLASFNRRMQAPL